MRARCHVRTAVTELGTDRHNLRAEDRDDVLLDLGLGTPTVDLCVRTTDPGHADHHGENSPKTRSSAGHGHPAGDQSGADDDVDGLGFGGIGCVGDPHEHH